MMVVIAELSCYVIEPCCFNLITPSIRPTYPIIIVVEATIIVVLLSNINSVIGLSAIAIDDKHSIEMENFISP